MRLSTLFVSSVAGLTASDAFAQVYDTGRATSAFWTHATGVCATSCPEAGSIRVGRGYETVHAFIAGWKCDWLGGRVEDMAVFGLGVREVSYDPATGVLDYELTSTMRYDTRLPQEFECTVQLGAIGGTSSAVHPYIGHDSCAGTNSCGTDTTHPGVAPLGMEWAGVVLRQFEVETQSGSGVPVHTIGVATTAVRTLADIDVHLGCSLTDLSGVPMRCESEWLSVATGPGDTLGVADWTSITWDDLYYGTTNPYAYAPLAGATCGQSGWYHHFTGGAAPLVGLASGYAPAGCTFRRDTMTNTWMTWLGDTYGATPTSKFYARHLGTALFLY
jgi:hypothetical protein